MVSPETSVKDARGSRRSVKDQNEAEVKVTRLSRGFAEDQTEADADVKVSSAEPNKGENALEGDVFII